MKYYAYVATLVSLSLLAKATNARIELVTVPFREGVSITIDKNNNALVQEVRTIALKKGDNIVQFDWSNVDIDMDTIMIMLKEGVEGVSIGSISIPPGSKNSVIWDVKSDRPLQTSALVAYKVAGIQWECNYIALVNEGETAIDLKAEVTISNNTEDKYENAVITLESGEPFTCSLDSNESRKIKLFTESGIPIEKTYTSDPTSADGRVALHYVFKNSRNELLLAGKVRLYKEGKDGSVAFLGEDRIGFIPAGGEIKLYTGDIRDVEVERAITKQQMVNVRKDSWGNIAVYDTEESCKITVKNHKKEPAKVIVRVHLNDLWENAESSHEYKKEDGNTLEYTITVPAGKEETITLKVSGKNLNQGFVL